MSKHTPGPWRVIHDRGNQWTVAAGSPHVSGMIQTVCTLNGPWKPENYQANAVLISRAPALLAALQEIEQLLDCGNIDQSHWDDCLDIARSALSVERRAQ